MYGGYYGYGYYFDPTYFLVLIGLVLCLGASALVNSTMRKYSKVRNMRGITGAEAARNLLNREGLYNVQIESQPQRISADDGRSVYGKDRIYEQGGILLCGSLETGRKMYDRGAACLRMAESQDL